MIREDTGKDGGVKGEKEGFGKTLGIGKNTC